MREAMQVGFSVDQVEFILFKKGQSPNTESLFSYILMTHMTRNDRPVG